MGDTPSESRGFRGYELNPTHSRSLADNVGGLLVNFGGIEFTADAWLHALTSDELAAESLHSLPLRRKIEVIRRLIRGGRVPASFLEEAESAWQQVSTLAELRNQVAHNPVVFGWHGEERNGPPDFAGVIDRRKNVQRTGPTPGLIPQSELAKAQNDAARLAQELYSLADRIEASEEGWPARPRRAV